MPDKPNAPNPLHFADTEPLTLAKDFEDAATEPAPLAPVANRADELALSLSLAPLEVSLYEVNAEIGRDQRVCPQPTRWLEFYRLLETSAAGAALPPPPLTGSAWASTPAQAKRMCFRTQVDWAAEHKCLTPVYEFLSKLPDTDWLRD